MQNFIINEKILSKKTFFKFTLEFIYQIKDIKYFLIDETFLEKI